MPAKKNLAPLEKDAFATPKVPSPSGSGTGSKLKQLKLTKGKTKNLMLSASKVNPPGKVGAAFLAAGASSKGINIVVNFRLINWLLCLYIAPPVSRSQSSSESLPDAANDGNESNAIILERFYRVGKNKTSTTEAIMRMASRYDAWDTVVAKADEYIGRIERGANLDQQKLFNAELVIVAWCYAVDKQQEAMISFLETFEKEPSARYSVEGILFEACQYLLGNGQEQAKVALDEACNHLEPDQVSFFMESLATYTGKARIF